MNEKIQFGVDFISVCRLLLGNSKSMKYFPIVDQASFLFLTLWGFTNDEINDVTSLFNKHQKNDNDYHFQSVERLTDHLRKRSKESQYMLIKQLVTLGSLNSDATEEAANFMQIFMRKFDMRPSEYKAVAMQGFEIAEYLKMFANVYVSEFIKIEGDDYKNWILEGAK